MDISAGDNAFVCHDREGVDLPRENKYLRPHSITMSSSRRGIMGNDIKRVIFSHSLIKLEEILFSLKVETMDDITRK